MKIKNATIKSGVIEFSNINLIIGGNNSGKSTLLKELNQSVKDWRIDPGANKWIETMVIELKNIKDEIDSIFLHPQSLRLIGSFGDDAVHKRIGLRAFRPELKYRIREFSLDMLQDSDFYNNNQTCDIEIVDINNNNAHRDYAREKVSHFLSLVGVAAEFCNTRLGQNFQTTVSDLLEDNDLMGDDMMKFLIKNPELLKKIQNNIQEVFSMNIGFDDLEQGNKSLRILPPKKPPKKLQAIERAEYWRDNSPVINDQGDGVRAYLNLIIKILDPYAKVILIDEPEAFLHPPQRRSLGRLISDLAAQHKKQLFIATHDAEFIRGALNSRQDVKVIRLMNGTSGRQTAELPLSSVSKVISNGKYKWGLEERIINSLFYDKVIITEGEPDRIFYEYFTSIYFSDKLSNNLFISVNGKDGAIKLLKIMHEFGSNACAILDIDFLLDRNAPRYIYDTDSGLERQHSKFKEKIRSLDNYRNFKENIKKNGIKTIEDDELYQAIVGLIDNFSKHGLYICSSGELESWTGVSKGNLSQMLAIIEKTRKRGLSNFLKAILQEENK